MAVHEQAIISRGVRIRFKYTNYKLETENRRASVHMVWFGSSEYHQGSQWFVRAFCLDRHAMRNFAMRDMSEVTIDQVRNGKQLELALGIDP